jgi:6-phosphogluconolactonase
MGIRHGLLWALPFFFFATTTNAIAVLPKILPDGRHVHIIKNDILTNTIGDFIVDRVEELACEAIAKKGAFSMSVGSGTTVTPLAQLVDCNVDFNKVHIFFGNERTEGEQAGKCASFGAEVFDILGIPEANLHKVPLLQAEDAAKVYEAEMRAMSRDIVGMNDNGMPQLDLCLLGSGSDGHCASLYPNSPQVIGSPGGSHAYLPAEGKGGITITIDAINSARNVIVSAGKASQSDMARKSLSWSNARTNHALPAGMISTTEGAVVEWILSHESAADLPAM